MRRTSPAGSTTAGRDKLDPALVRLIVILLLGAIPSLLDTTIVNVAIDTVGRDLHATVSQIQWVITGYLLSFGMVIPLSGWALARFGGRASWLFALTVFLAGSVLSGAAWNIGSLIGFRVLQGLGGGLLLPLLTTLITQAAGGRQLGRLMASVSLPVAVVPILGPVISGLIISNVSWRWIFYVNVPICLTGMILAWRGLPAGRPGQAAAAAGARPRLDITGLVLLCPALAALLYGLAQVSSAGGFGHLRVLIPLLAGSVLLAAFAVHALRMTGEPLVDLRLFRSRSFAAASSLMFLAGLSIYGAMLLLPLYFQQARGYSALTAGLLLVPQGIGSILPRTIVGKLTDRIGPRPVSRGGHRARGSGHRAVRAGRPAHQRGAARRGPGRARCRTRRCDDRADGRRLPGTAETGASACQQRHQDHAAGRRSLWCRGPRRHPVPAGGRPSGSGRDHRRVRPHLLVVHRVLRAGRAARAPAARPPRRPEPERPDAAPAGRQLDRGSPASRTAGSRQ